MHNSFVSVVSGWSSYTGMNIMHGVSLLFVLVVEMFKIMEMLLEIPLNSLDCNRMEILESSSPSRLPLAVKKYIPSAAQNFGCGMH